MIHKHLLRKRRARVHEFIDSVVKRFLGSWPLGLILVRILAKLLDSSVLELRNLYTLKFLGFPHLLNRLMYIIGYLG